MSNDMDHPHVPPPHPAVAPGSSMPKQPAEHLRVDADGVLQRPTWWRRVKARFAGAPGRHDSYVSNVTNPDDRFIPRR